MQDSRVQAGRRELREVLVLKDFKVFLVQKVHKVIREYWVQVGLQDGLDQPDLLALLDHRVEQVCSVNAVFVSALRSPKLLHCPHIFGTLRGNTERANFAW